MTVFSEKKLQASKSKQVNIFKWHLKSVVCDSNFWECCGMRGHRPEYVLTTVTTKNINHFLTHALFFFYQM